MEKRAVSSFSIYPFLLFFSIFSGVSPTNNVMLGTYPPNKAKTAKFNNGDIFFLQNEVNK